jgi:hypothetical protein
MPIGVGLTPMTLSALITRLGSPNWNFEVRTGRHDHGTLDEILQFAYVAGQSCCWRNSIAPPGILANLLIHTRRKLANEVPHQKRNVFRTLPQRRKCDRKHIEAVKQIRAEPPLSNHLGQILIRGCHNTNVNPDGAVASEPLKFLFLENAQELRLQFERQIAHLIQKQRTCVGVLKAPGRLSPRSGECSALVAEEFALDETIWHCRAVHLGLGDQFFARTGLAQDKDRRIGSSGQVQ